MVIALEPKFVLPHHGAIGIEISVIVRRDGMERVTENPLALVRV
jgi:Xaa-Pro aminopeptidase